MAAPSPPAASPTCAATPARRCTRSPPREPDGLAHAEGVADCVCERLDGQVDTRFTIDAEHLDATIGRLHAARIHTLTVTPPSLDALFLRSYGRAPRRPRDRRNACRGRAMSARHRAGESPPARAGHHGRDRLAHPPPQHPRLGDRPRREHDRHSRRRRRPLRHPGQDPHLCRGGHLRQRAGRDQRPRRGHRQPGRGDPGRVRVPGLVPAPAAGHRTDRRLDTTGGGVGPARDDPRRPDRPAPAGSGGPRRGDRGDSRHVRPVRRRAGALGGSGVRLDPLQRGARRAGLRVRRVRGAAGATRAARPRRLHVEPDRARRGVRPARGRRHDHELVDLAVSAGVGGEDRTVRGPAVVGARRPGRLPALPRAARPCGWPLAATSAAPCCAAARVRHERPGCGDGRSASRPGSTARRPRAGWRAGSCSPR